MITVRVTDEEKGCINEYTTDQILLLLYAVGDDKPMLVEDENVTYAKKADAIIAVINDICLSKMAAKTKKSLLNKIRNYMHVLVGVLEDR